MDQDARDALFAKVFATPAGARLIEDLRDRDFKILTLAEIETRLSRTRKRWATGPESPE